MNCANLRGDQWISNETINHLISKTNQTCQGGRLRSWTSSSDFLFSRQKHNIFNEYLASGGAELCLCRRCAGKNIFGFLSSKIWDFQFEIVWTFNLFKCQNTNSSLSPPPPIHWYFTKVIRELWRPALTRRYKSSRSSSELLTSGYSALQIVAFITGNQFCGTVEPTPSLHQRLFGAQLLDPGENKAR